MASYGIKVNNWTSLNSRYISLSDDEGEGNAGYSADHSEYACLFSKMIENWREIWNERTNGTTDIQFPFGFVQVSLFSSKTLSFNWSIDFQLSTESNSSSAIGGKPWIRWRQTFDIGYVPNAVVPRVFMAVTCDLRDDPHG